MVCLTQQISKVESRVYTLESSLTDVTKKLIDYEKSRNFDSDVCNDLAKKYSTLENQIENEMQTNERLTNE